MNLTNRENAEHSARIACIVSPIAQLLFMNIASGARGFVLFELLAVAFAVMILVDAVMGNLLGMRTALKMCIASVLGFVGTAFALSVLATVLLNLLHGLGIPLRSYLSPILAPIGFVYVGLICAGSYLAGVALLPLQVPPTPQSEISTEESEE